LETTSPSGIADSVNRNAPEVIRDSWNRSSTMPLNRCDDITYQHIVVDDEDGAGCIHAASSGFVAMRAVKVAADRPNSTTVTASQCRKNG
jgi:hypothetical protein